MSVERFAKLCFNAALSTAVLLPESTAPAGTDLRISSANGERSVQLFPRSEENI